MTEAAVQGLSIQNRLVIDGEVGLKNMDCLYSKKTKPALGSPKTNFWKKNDPDSIFQKSIGVETRRNQGPSMKSFKAPEKGFCFVDGKKSENSFLKGSHLLETIKRREIRIPGPSF